MKPSFAAVIGGRPAAQPASAQYGRAGGSFGVGRLSGPLRQDAMHTIANEADLAAPEIFRENRVHLAAQDMQYAHNVFRRLVILDVLSDIGCEPVDVGIDGDSLVAPRVARREAFKVEVRERRSVSAKAERADGVRLKILTPVAQHRVRADRQIGFFLAGGNVCRAEGEGVLVRNLVKINRRARDVRQIDSGGCSAASALGGMIGGLPEK